MSDGLPTPDDALRTPRQIRAAALDRLRGDERLWAAYERGWCDFLKVYLDSKLMQGETDYITAPPIMDHKDDTPISGDRVVPVDEHSSPPLPPPSADFRNPPPKPPPSAEGAVGLQPSPPPVDSDFDAGRAGTAPSSESEGGTKSDTDDCGGGCYETRGSDGSANGCTCAPDYASDDSSRDADAEVRRVMFGDKSPDSSDVEAMRSFSDDDGPSEDDSTASSG